MRILSQNILATLSMGFIGLLIIPLLHAQDFPADITRGKGVYQRNCQACHGVGGWGDGPEAQALKILAGQLPPLFVLSEIRRRIAADH